MHLTELERGAAPAEDREERITFLPQMGLRNQHLSSTTSFRVKKKYIETRNSELKRDFCFRSQNLLPLTYFFQICQNKPEIYPPKHLFSRHWNSTPFLLDKLPTSSKEWPLSCTNDRHWYVKTPVGLVNSCQRWWWWFQWWYLIRNITYWKGIFFFLTASTVDIIEADPKNLWSLNLVKIMT